MDKTAQVDALTNKNQQRIDVAITSFEDYQRLRNDWTGRPAIPTLVHRDNVRSVASNGQVAHVLLDGDSSGGRVSVFHLTLQPGFRAPPHHQPNEDEHFYVLEGELELTIGSKTVKAGPGSFGFAPRNATHAFRVIGDQPARVLTWNSPGGHERMFENGERRARAGLEVDAETKRRQRESYDTYFHDESGPKPSAAE